jgi:hypothetical protein
LQEAGVPPVANASLAAYERALLAIMSGGLAMLGAVYLLGGATLEQFMGALSLGQIALAACGGGVLSYLLGRGHFEKTLARKLLAWESARSLLETAGTVLVGQALMLSCFVIGFASVAPDIDVPMLFAASAIVSFAASMPVSLGGWGVRELAAVYVLGKLGVPAADAMAVSVTIGVCSTLVVIAVAPFTLGKSLKHSPSPIQFAAAGMMVDLQKSAAWILSFAAAVTVFFQMHVPLAGGAANLNLADPFAILALAAVSLHVMHHRQLPRWRVGRFNLALAAIGLLLLFGFVRGWLEIGVTQWALGGRLIGWLVLLGYLAAGYMIAENHGTHGMRRFAETLAAVACMIVVQQVILRALSDMGSNPLGALTISFEGYAGNRNAFAFQLLVVWALLVGYSRLHARRCRDGFGRMRFTALSLLHGTVLSGIALTGSRAALGTAGIMLLAAWFGRLADRRMLVGGIVAASVLWTGSQAIQYTVPGQPTVPGLPPWQTPGATYVQTPFSSDISDQGRWIANRHALEMWRTAPVFGVGLGVFFAKSAQWFEAPMVIHSTPVWLLTEFGLLGIALFGWLFYLLLRHVFSGWASLPKLPGDRALLFLLLVFAIFSQVHEMLYQRIFWLVLGVLLARPWPPAVTGRG